MNRKEFIKFELIKNPQDPFNLYLLALEFLRENNRGEAMLLFKNIYESSPNYLPLYYTYALNLIETGNFDAAKMIVQKGIEIATYMNKEKTKNELEQLNILYFD